MIKTENYKHLFDINTDYLADEFLLSKDFFLADREVWDPLYFALDTNISVPVILQLKEILDEK